jgi:uncharacterized MnhB-related membrane protein
MLKAVIATGFVMFLAFVLYAMLTAGRENRYRY